MEITRQRGLQLACAIAIELGDPAALHTCVTRAELVEFIGVESDIQLATQMKLCVYAGDIAQFMNESREQLDARTSELVEIGIVGIDQGVQHARRSPRGFADRLVFFH